MSDEKKKNKKKIIIVASIIILLIAIVVFVSLVFLHKNKSDNTETENNSQELIDTEPPVLILKENVEITNVEKITTDLFVESCTDNESKCVIKFLYDDNEVETFTLDVGEYEITVIAYDEAKNKTESKTKLTIITSELENEEESSTENNTTTNPGNSSSENPGSNNSQNSKPNTSNNNSSTGSNNNSNNNNNSSNTGSNNSGSNNTATPEPPVVEPPKTCNKTNSRPERIIYKEIPCGETNTQKYLNEVGSKLNTILDLDSTWNESYACFAHYGDQYCFGTLSSPSYVYNTDYEVIGIYIEFSMYHSEYNGGPKTLVGKGYIKPDNTIIYSWKNY